LSEKVNEVSISGCKYELAGEELERFKTRGISNEIVDQFASITVQNGILLYVLYKNISASF
jgi:thiamine pyrophosphokinase